MLRPQTGALPRAAGPGPPPPASGWRRIEPGDDGDAHRGEAQGRGITTEPARFDGSPAELGVAGRIEANPTAGSRSAPRRGRRPRGPRRARPERQARRRAGHARQPRLGTARLNLRARQRELATARIEADWKTEVAANVALLIPELRKGTDPAAIEKQFADKPLGAYRGTLLQAYAEFDIATHEEEKTAGLRSQDIVGEHPAVVAQHTREGLQAKLEAAIEQVQFDAAQEKRLADQQVRQAEAAVIDAAQRLRILGVAEDIQRPARPCRPGRRRSPSTRT